MDLSSLGDFISNFGFPIAVCFACFKYIKEQMEAMTKALQNNTLVMQKLVDKMGGLEGEMHIE